MPSANVNGVHLNYQMEGAGNAVLFVHGYTGSSKDWTRQVSALSPAYRVAAVDLRGHGKSDAPSKEEDYSMEIFRDDVLGLLDHLPMEKCCLVGHSLGGFIALEFALAYAHRLAGLVLVDTSSGDWDRPAGYGDLRIKLDEVARKEGMEAAFQYDASHNPLRIERFQKHPELREVFRQKMRMTSVDGYIYAGKAMGRWQPVTERLPHITVPTLVVWGEEDWPFRTSARILKERIPNARLVTIQAVGHSPHEEAPEVFNDVLTKFLKEIDF